jgi:hypothetical protein
MAPMVILHTYDKVKPLVEKFFIWAWILLVVWRMTPGQYMGCVVQLTGLSHNDFHFLSQWSLFKSNNYARKIPTSGRKLFCLSMNFGYHLAVVPPSGSSVWWLKKNPDFVQKQKKSSTKCPFWAVSAQRTYCAGSFLAFVRPLDHCGSWTWTLCTRELE